MSSECPVLRRSTEGFYRILGEMPGAAQVGWMPRQAHNSWLPIWCENILKVNVFWFQSQQLRIWLRRDSTTQP